MKTVKQLIESYIESKNLAWSPSSLRSERYRLLSVADHLPPAVSSNPDQLWRHLVQSGVSPYARVTLWTRVSCFVDFLIEHKIVEKNDFKAFKKINARQFKNCYVRKPAAIDFDHARSLIESIADTGSREFALNLLLSGMRTSEGLSATNGEVIGKGNKRRRVYNTSNTHAGYTASYSTFRRHLAAVGLKPHDLRKIALTRIVELGADAFELCKVAGWASLEPALSYINSNDEKIKTLMGKLNK